MVKNNQKADRAFPAAIWQMALIILLGSFMGLAVNSVRAGGIPLVGSVRVVKFDDPAATRPLEAVTAPPAAEAVEAELQPAEPLAPPPEEVVPQSEDAGVEVFSPVPVAEEPSEEAGEGPRAVDLAQAMELFEGGQTIFVDARGRDEFVAGHIPAAFSLPYEEMEAYLDVLNYLSDDGLVVTYCDGSDCRKSLDLADELTAMGFGRVRVFFGGWEEWVDAGFPVEEGEPFLP